MANPEQNAWFQFDFQNQQHRGPNFGEQPPLPLRTYYVRGLGRTAEQAHHGLIQAYPGLEGKMYYPRLVTPTVEKELDGTFPVDEQNPLETQEIVDPVVKAAAENRLLHPES